MSECPLADQEPYDCTWCRDGIPDPRHPAGGTSEPQDYYESYDGYC